MARPVAGQPLARVRPRLVLTASRLLGVLVGVLCGIGMLSLGIVGAIMVAGLTTGLGLLVVSAWRAGPVEPVPELVGTRGRVLALSISSMAATGWIHLGSYRWPVAAVLAVLGAVVQEWVPLLGRTGASRRRYDRNLRPRELADLLSRLPTDVLLAEWDGTGRAVALHPGLRAEGDLVRLRALLLDELERRDAKGFAAWQQAWQQRVGRRPCTPEGFLDDGG